MKCAIYGAGSLGTILGVYLTKGGVAVDLINRNRDHVDAMKKNGATVTGTVQMTVPVKALLPEEMTAQYDVIFLLTKQTENRTVSEALKKYLAAGGVVCTLQNGLPEVLLGEILGEDTVLGCVVEWGATLQSPGVSELTSETDCLTFSMGSLQRRTDGKLMEVKALLEKMGPVTVEENWIGTRYAKLLINSAFSGVSAVAGVTFGAAAKDKRSRACIQAVIKECIDTAKAAGITIEPVQGKDIVKLMDYRGALKKKISFMIIPMAIKKHAKLKASLLQDLEKGKKTEIDYINGTVCDFGKKHGVQTPLNARVVSMNHEIEAGKRSPGMDNIRSLLKAAEGLK
jgi:2-dehydropantoate 2-reductase